MEEAEDPDGSLTDFFTARLCDGGAVKSERDLGAFSEIRWDTLLLFEDFLCVCGQGVPVSLLRSVARV